MAHQIKYSEWESATGKSYCNDVSDLGGQAGLWWILARKMNLTPAEWVKWLIDNYHPDHIELCGKVLIYSWDKVHKNLCHNFVLYVNRQKFII